MKIDLTIIITYVIDILLTALATFISVKVIPFLQERGLYEYAKRAVRAASTLFGDGDGEKKFNWALDKLASSRFGKMFDVYELKDQLQAAYVDFCAELGKEPGKAAETYFESTEGK